MSTEEWETFNSGNWALYAIALTEQAGSGYYRADYPSGVGDDVLTTDVLYSQVGGTPAISDAPPVGIGQSQGVAVAAIRDGVEEAINLKKNLGSMVIGAVASGTPTTTQMITDLPESLHNVYVGRLIIWTSGVLKRAAAYIVAYNGDAKLLTFGAVPTAPAVGDEFIIV
jgi:hypothetical protein